MLDSDPSKFVFSDALKLYNIFGPGYIMEVNLKYFTPLRFAMVTDTCIMEEGTAKGYIIVADMSGFVFGHLAKLGILTIKKYMIYLQVSKY